MRSRYLTPSLVFCLVAALAPLSSARGQASAPQQGVPGVPSRRIGSGLFELPADNVNVPRGRSHQVSVLPSVEISAVDVSGARLLDATAVEDATRTLLRNKPVTFEDLIAVRDHLTKLYRDAGYITSGVLLPEQESLDGRVAYKAVESQLVSVHVSGLERLDPAVIRRPLEKHKGKVFNLNDIGQTLRDLQTDPNIGSLKAEVGLLSVAPDELATTLAIHATERNPWHLQAAYDNWQSPSIGPQAWEIRATHTNIFRRGETLDLSYRAASGVSTIRAALGFRLMDSGTRIGIRYSKTLADVVEKPFDRLDIESDAVTYALDLEHPVLRRYYERSNRDVALSVHLSLEHRRSRSSLLGRDFSFSPQNEDATSRLSVLRGGGELIFREPDRVFSLRTTLNYGLRAIDATTERGDEPDGQFVSWLTQIGFARRLCLSRPRPRPDEPAKRLGIRSLCESSRVVLRGALQLANHPLLAIERFPIGGHASVRGYRENQLVRDNGFYASLELRVPVPIFLQATGEPRFEVAPFVDVGMGWNQRVSTPSVKTISSAGVGLIVRLSDRLNAEISWAEAFRDLPAGGRDSNFQEDGIQFRLLARVL